jgi:type VII secretion protein EccB
VWTQRDQIQAYQFLRRRLVSALVAGDANHPTSPSRRLVLGTILGIGAAVLTTAVFGIIGLLNPSGSGDWRQGGQVIVEQGNGARYVLGQDGLLHPVLNYASARLLAGGNANQTVTVSADTLRGASRGAMLGIPGAPDSLPAADALSDSTFTSCTRTPPDLPAAAPPVSTVILGSAGPAGRVLGAGQALLVSAAGGDSFLVADGRRYRLAGQAPVAALGYEDVPVRRVSAAWLDTVPAGPDLGLVDVPGAGDQGPVVGGVATRVGQVLGDGDYYLVESDGVSPIGATEARLVLGDSADAAAYSGGRAGVVTLPVSALDAAPRSRRADPGAGYPIAVPVPAAVVSGAVLCSVSGGGSARILTADRLPLPSGGRAVQVDVRTDARVADEVYVPPGTGVLVRERVGSGAAVGGLYLITDAGLKYPVPGQAAAAALGYSGAPAVPVSGAVLGLLSTGPSLDPVAAQRVVVSR